MAEDHESTTVLLKRVSPFWSAVRSRVTPAMIASVIAIIFSAGVAWTDLRKSAHIEALEKDVAALQIDRRRLDEERERATSRLNLLEDQMAEHERKWQRVEEVAEIHINPPARGRKRSR